VTDPLERSLSLQPYRIFATHPSQSFAATHGCQAQTSVKICLLSFVPCAYDSLLDLCAAGLLALQHSFCRQPAGRATLAAAKVRSRKGMQLVSRLTLPAANRWCLLACHANVLCRHYFWNEVTGDTQYEDPGGM